MTRVSLTIGAVVQHQMEEAVIVAHETADSVLLQYPRTGKFRVIAAEEVEPSVSTNISPRAQRLCREIIELVSVERWEVAKERIDVLRDLINLPRYARGLPLVQAAAAKLDRSVATVYRLISEYDKTKSLRVFLRLQRKDKRSGRLQPKIERAIRAAIKSKYLDDQRLMISTIVEIVQRRCRKRGWPEPSESSVVRRIRRLAPVTEANAREGKSGAPGRLEQRRGKHPHVPFPLQLWQVDHTPTNYCIVDEVYGLPLDGAQTLSIALDINTRCVLGFTLFIEKPSVRVLGACVAMAILPKEQYLRDLDVDAYWPCYGMPSVIYSDSGPDFRGIDYYKALELHNIEARRRPKKAPNYAGHIESLFSKFIKHVHQLKGARFANLKERMKYDTAGRAVMTLNDFRRWFTIFITKRYHQMPHSGLDDLPPIRAWERGILGHGDQVGIGLPDRITDEFRLRLDFLPSERRRVHPDGIQIGRRSFQSNQLARWVGAKNPHEEDGKFVCKFDPFDMDEIYFLDPELGEYLSVPITGEAQGLTLWEISQVKQRIRSSNRSEVDQKTIDEGAEEMREIEREAALRTTSARRAQQRLLDASRNSIPRARRRQESAGEEITYSDSPPGEADAPDLIDGPVEPIKGAIAPTVKVGL